MNRLMKWLRRRLSEMRETDIERILRIRKELGYVTEEEQLKDISTSIGRLENDSASSSGGPSEHSSFSPLVSDTLINIVLLPFRLAWDMAVVAAAITLEIAWLGFIFGSVVGVIILLVFFPQGFGLPLLLLGFLVKLWPDER